MSTSFAPPAGAEAAVRLRRLRRRGHGCKSVESLLPPVPPDALSVGRQHRAGDFSSQSQAYTAIVSARAALLTPAPEELSTGEWLPFWLEEKQRAGGASAAGRKLAATTARGYDSAVVS